jgi:hypothetical protein
MASSNGDYGVIREYAREQSLSSWSNTSCLFKEIMLGQRTITEAGYWMGVDDKDSGISVKDKANLARKKLHEAGIDSKLLDSIAAQHAFNYELIRKVQIESKSEDGKTIQVFRTESALRLGKSGLRVGTKKAFKKGILESTSMFKPVACDAGEEVTVYNVPLHRMFANFMTSARGTNTLGMFLSDRENEATVMLEGLEAHYVGSLYDVGYS